MRDFLGFVWQILFNGAVGAALVLDLVLYSADYLAKTRGTSSTFSVPPVLYVVIFALGILVAAYRANHEAYERGRKAALTEGELRFDVDPATIAYRARDGKGAEVLLYGTVRNNGPAIKLVNPRLDDDKGGVYRISEPQGQIMTRSGLIGGVGGPTWYGPSRAKIIASDSVQDVAFHFHCDDPGWERGTKETHYMFTVSDDRDRSHYVEFTCRVHDGDG